MVDRVRRHARYRSSGQRENHRRRNSERPAHLPCRFYADQRWVRRRRAPEKTARRQFATPAAVSIIDLVLFNRCAAFVRPSRLSVCMPLVRNDLLSHENKPDSKTDVRRRRPEKARHDCRQWCQCCRNTHMRMYAALFFLQPSLRSPPWAYRRVCTAMQACHAVDGLSVWT